MKLNDADEGLVMIQHMQCLLWLDYASFGYHLLPFDWFISVTCAVIIKGGGDVYCNSHCTLITDTINSRKMTNKVDESKSILSNSDAEIVMP